MRFINWLIRRRMNPQCPFCREELEEGHSCAMSRHFMREFASEIRRLQIMDSPDRQKTKVEI